MVFPLCEEILQKGKGYKIVFSVSTWLCQSGSHRASEHRSLRPCIHSMSSLKPDVTQTKLAFLISSFPIHLLFPGLDLLQPWELCLAFPLSDATNAPRAFHTLDTFFLYQNVLPCVSFPQLSALCLETEKLSCLQLKV